MQSGKEHGTGHVARVRERTHDEQKDRRAVILTLLQRKDRIAIKDVTAVIRDVSDKTIQRELLALVAQGVLIKDGERRWSTYRLA
jgi:predicted ArsR family transcriptional regulator